MSTRALESQYVQANDNQGHYDFTPEADAG